MSTVIKGGTIVTADLTYKADVKIDGGVIVEIGPDLKCCIVLDGADYSVRLQSALETVEIVA